MSSLRAAALLIALTGCSDAGRSPQGNAPRDTPYQQELHLASLANGAVVADRSAERGLRHSAVMALDGSVYTGWFSPPGAPDQWMLVRLPATSRIDGIRVVTHHVHRVAPQVRVEGSIAGDQWRELATIDVDADERETSIRLEPSEVEMLRVTMLGPAGSSSGLTDFVATGQETGQREPVSWEGSWRLNQREARFASRGSMVSGHVPFLRAPMTLIGRPHQGFLPFAWSMGYTTGYGFMAASAAGELSGYWAWDDHFDWQIGESWYGRRSSGEEAAAVDIDRRKFALDFLRRGRGAPFFELVDEGGALSAGPEADEAFGVIREIVKANPEVEFRLVAFDVEGVPSAEGLVRSAETAMRRNPDDLPNLQFAVAAGNMLEQPPRHAQSRALYRRMDLEIGSSAAGNAPPIVLR